MGGINPTAYSREQGLLASESGCPGIGFQKESRAIFPAARDMALGLSPSQGAEALPCTI